MKINEFSTCFSTWNTFTTYIGFQPGMDAFGLKPKLNGWILNHELKLVAIENPFSNPFRNNLSRLRG